MGNRPLWAIVGYGPLRVNAKCRLYVLQYGRALHHNTCCNFILKLDTMLCGFVGLQIRRPYFELCIVGLVLCMMQTCSHCGPLQAIVDCSCCGPLQVQPLRTNAKCVGPMNFSIRWICIIHIT